MAPGRDWQAAPENPSPACLVNLLEHLPRGWRPRPSQPATTGLISAGQRLAGLPFLHGLPHVLNGPVLAPFDHAHP